MLASMQYTSTRDRNHKQSFAEIALGGMAPDGGLYVPTKLPESLAFKQRTGWPKADYAMLATQIIAPFMGDAVPSATLTQLISNAYATFSDARITPLKQLDDQLTILELFHGPSLAFKDVAMQFLGQLFGHSLSTQNKAVTIVSATSGDTGSAAVAAFANIANVKLIVLYPHERISDFQRRQMTTSGAANVEILAIEGTFDDCQQIVKTLLNDAELKAQRNLAAINSINWCRIMAQMVYYIYVLLQYETQQTFVVPTGNFGNAYAAHLVRRLNWPIDQIVIGNNANDAITQLVQTGKLQRGKVTPTISNAIDIQIPSNLERYLWELFAQDSSQLTEWLDGFNQTGEANLSSEQHIQLREHFLAAAITDAETRATMRDIHARFGYIIDPHTAVGIAAANKTLPPEQPRIALACAAPQKFQATVEASLGQPLAFQDPLTGKKEAFTVLPVDLAKIRTTIAAF